jgi:hypothetical protein
MATYILYDKGGGEILHVHREQFMDSEATVELSEEALFREVGALLPAGVEVGVLACDAYPERVRGYRYYVDPTTRQLAMLERPRQTREVRS